MLVGHVATNSAHWDMAHAMHHHCSYCKLCMLSLTCCNHYVQHRHLICCREVKTLGVNLEGGVPDGMCLDHEGRIWTALCGGGAVVCIDPESGDELHR